MKTASLVIGILGGVFGIISAIMALAVGGLGQAFHTHNGTEVAQLGWLALVCALVGILGAGLVMAKPRLGAAILLIAAIGITISISFFAVVAAPLLFIAAVLGFFGRKSGREAAPMPATV